MEAVEEQHERVFFLFLSFFHIIFICIVRYKRRKKNIHGNHRLDQVLSWLRETHRAQRGADGEGAASDLAEFIDAHALEQLYQRDACTRIKVEHRLWRERLARERGEGWMYCVFVFLFCCNLCVRM